MNSYPLLTPIAISDPSGHGWGGVLAPVVNVRDKGAKGDGKTDDTGAFQAAVDAVPLSGGTVIVPRGDYRIDVTKAIVLHSNMLLLLDPAATLAALPTAEGRYWVIKVWEADNVRIVGGRIVGERRGHLGTVGEQGYGINIQASHNVMVSDVYLSDFWGDGIWIGALGPDGKAVPATDVVVNRVVSTNNRRQGLSIGPAENVVIMNSTFSGTEGTNPQAGIDIEPQRQGMTRNITISHCILTRNRGCGIEIHGNVVGVTVDNCEIHDNFGYGVMTKEEANMEEREPTALNFSRNTITRNGLVGMIVAGETNYMHIADSTLVGNGFRYPLDPNEDPNAEWSTFREVGINAAQDAEHSVEPELMIRDTANNVTVRSNTFTQK